jgi:hypothetical protein
MSIFGISVIDNFGFNYVTHFIEEFKSVTYNILSYLSDTSFYKYLRELYIPKNEGINPNADKYEPLKRTYEHDILNTKIKPVIPDSVQTEQNIRKTYNESISE